MADLTPRQGEGLQSEIRTRYKDMSDGTHAPVVATTSLGTLAGSPPSEVATFIEQAAIDLRGF